MSIFNRGNKSADVETTIPIYDIPQPVSPDTGYGSYGADQYSGYGSTINFDEEKTMPMTGPGTGSPKRAVTALPAN